MGYSEKRVREDIPPPDVWLYDPRYTPLETPLDSRGLVDFEELIRIVKSTVDSSYKWESPFNDRHHLQWPRRFYPEEYRNGPNPAEFRHLGVGIVRVPRYFHNWVHLITEPPKLPSEEVMQYRIDAQRVALSLFESVKFVKQEGRVRLLSGQALKDYMLGELELRFEDFSETFDDAKHQPVEFYPVNYDKLELNGPKDMIIIADRIAREAIYKSAIRSIGEPLVA